MMYTKINHRIVSSMKNCEGMRYAANGFVVAGKIHVECKVMERKMFGMD